MPNDDIHISFQHMEATDAIKEFVYKHVERLHKYVSYPLKVNVVLFVERHLQCAEIKCHAEHKELSALAESEDLYASIDQAVEKMENQLKRERDKRKGHHKAHGLDGPRGERLAQDIEAQIPHQNKKRV